MRKILIIACAMLAAPAFAATPTAADTSRAAQSADAKKVVCKAQVNTGTRFPERKCMTKAQWDRMIEQHRREAKELIDRPMVAPPGN